MGNRTNSERIAELESRVEALEGHLAAMKEGMRRAFGAADRELPPDLAAGEKEPERAPLRVVR